MALDSAHAHAIRQCGSRVGSGGAILQPGILVNEVWAVFTEPFQSHLCSECWCTSLLIADIWSHHQMWREVVKRYKNMNAPPICPRHFGTSAEMSVGHFGPFIKCWDSSAPVPKCPKDTSAPTQKSKTFWYEIIAKQIMTVLYQLW